MGLGLGREIPRDRFVSDIFHEVDEEVRRERLNKLWERYGNLLVAAAVVVVAGIAGWRGYGWWEAKKAAESGAAFQTAMSLSEAGKHSEAEVDYAKIAGNGTSGYRNLARLRRLLGRSSIGQSIGQKCGVEESHGLSELLIPSILAV